ncbi:MAG: hypothetical protein NTX05_03565 [Fusobacteria bacterium]|nr:hypothetical protein [Fusobacteriota bacterium]
MRKSIQALIYVMCAAGALAATSGSSSVSGSSSISGSSTTAFELPVFQNTSLYPQQADVNFQNNSLQVTGGFRANIAGTQIIATNVTKEANENFVTIEGDITVYSPVQGGMIFKANKAIFNLANNTMQVYGISGYASQVFFKAAFANISSDGNILLSSGTISTDPNLVTPNAVPEYSVSGKSIFINPTEYISGTNLTAQIQGKNVFWFPWYAGSIAPNGPNLFPLPGSSSEYGNYLLFGSYYDLNPEYARGYVNTRWSEKNGWYLDQLYNQYIFSPDNYGSIWIQNVLAVPKSGVQGNTWQVTWLHSLELNNDSGFLRHGNWNFNVQNIAIASLNDSTGNSISFTTPPSQGSYWKSIVTGNQNIGSDGVLTANISDANLWLTQQILNSGNKNSVTGLPNSELWEKLNYTQQNSVYNWTSYYDRENTLFPYSNGGTAFSFKNNWGTSYTLKAQKMTFAYNHINQDVWATTMYNPSASLPLYNTDNHFTYSTDMGAYELGNSQWTIAATASNHQEGVSKNDWYTVQNWINMAPRAIYLDNSDYNQIGMTLTSAPLDVGKAGILNMAATVKQNSYTTNQSLTGTSFNAKLTTPLVGSSGSSTILTNTIPFHLKNNTGTSPTIMPYQTSFVNGTTTMVATLPIMNEQKIGEGLTLQTQGYAFTNLISAKQGFAYGTSSQLLLNKDENLTVSKNGNVANFYVGDSHLNYAINPDFVQSYNQKAGVSYYSKPLNGTFSLDYLNNRDFNTANITSTTPNNDLYDYAVSRTYSYATQYWGASYQPVQLYIANSNLQGTLADGYLDNYTVAWSNNQLEVNRYLKVTYSHVRTLNYNAFAFQNSGLTLPTDSMNVQFNLTDMRKFYTYWQEQQLKNVKAVEPNAQTEFNISGASIPADANYSTSYYSNNLMANNSVSPSSSGQGSQSSGSSEINAAAIQNTSGSGILTDNYSPYNLSSLGNNDQNYFYNSIIQYGVGVNLNYDNQYIQQGNSFASSITNAGVNVTFKQGDVLYLTPQYFLSRNNPGNAPLTSNFGGQAIVKVAGPKDYAWWVGTNYYKNYYNYQNPVQLYSQNGQQTSRTWGFTVSHQVRELQFSVGYTMNWDQFNHNFNNQISLSIWTVAFPTAMMAMGVPIN